MQNHIDGKKIYWYDVFALENPCKYFLRDVKTQTANPLFISVREQSESLVIKAQTAKSYFIAKATEQSVLKVVL